MASLKVYEWLLIPWKKRIKQAIQNKKFTKSDLDLCQLWITNPISELIHIIEFNENQVYRGPKDIYLVLDGIYFTKAVEENDILLALNCMRSINKRVLKLHGIEPWPNI